MRGRGGSSPLSRGIPRPRHSAGRRRRIIPALAGNTPASASRFFTAWDHPRSRGEYHCPGVTNQRDFGSSPLSRGIRTLTALMTSLHGIIPALAGNTTTSESIAMEREDHPRSRGEYGPAQDQPGLRSGSSPLSRGILAGAFRVAPAGRIIPALAGNTNSF